MIIVSENDYSQLLETEAEIIEVFEDFLDRRGIVIENDEKLESEGPSIIYGSDFGELQDQIEAILYGRGCVLHHNSYDTRPVYIRVV